MEKSNLLTAEEAARYLRISINTLRSWTSQRRMPFTKVGGRALYPLASLQKFIIDGTFEPEPRLGKETREAK
jgi:excisionase family DNA binding protein